MKNIIKVISLLVAVAITCVLACGCGATASSNVVVSASTTEYGTNTEKINVTIENKSKDKVFYLPDFSLEVNNNGKWETVQPLSIAKQDIISFVEAGGKQQQDFYVSERYGELKSGKYRIVVTTANNEDDLQNKGKAVYFEFNIA